MDVYPNGNPRINRNSILLASDFFKICYRLGKKKTQPGNDLKTRRLKSKKKDSSHSWNISWQIMIKSKAEVIKKYQATNCSLM